MPPEQILVVPRNKLFNGKPIPHGFGYAKAGDGLINCIYKHAYFIDRPETEHNSELKQIIPYIMVTSGDKIFALHRKDSQTEKRLHHKYSIGVGGHINPATENKQLDNIIELGLERELHEELSVKCDYQYNLIGYLNDDTNEVGSVHFGLVHRLEVIDQKSVEVAEKDMMSGQFMTVTEIEKIYPLLETWSQFLFNAVKKELC